MLFRSWFVVSETGGAITDTTPYVVARNEAEAREKAEAQFGGDTHAHPVVLEQDPDALDTWFSSGLWPFSTLGWPDAGAADLTRWYPTSVLVTGFDIIFFWVARMTMMAGAFTGQMPFQDVYIHGLVRDENNRKMSKSAGNGIDPLLLIDRYGADALRFALVREVAGAGQDIRLDYDRKSDTSATVEASRNFANKLWNATRFALMNLDGETPASLGEPDPAYKERRREHCRTWRQRLKQDPLRLAEHREKERKRHKARVARMAVEEPDRLAAEKARHVQSTRAWRARQNAENREEFLAKRREYQARRKASMTPEQLQVHKEKNRARDKARRENYTEAQKERQRASWRKHREKVQADPERAEARRIKQREYSRRWREKKKRGGC